VLNLGHGAFSVAVVAASLGVAALVGPDSGRPWLLVVVGVVLLGCAVLTVLMRVPVRPRGASRPVVRRRWSWPLLALGGLAAVAYLVENAWQSWGAIHLHSTLGASLQFAALAPAVFAGCAALGRFAAHPLTARVRPAVQLATGATLAALGSVLAALGHPAPLVLVGIGIAGLGTSVCAPTLIAIGGRRSPDAPGAAAGTVITLAYLGFVFGPALVGLLSGATTLPIALVVVAVAAAALAVSSPAVARLDPTPARTAVDEPALTATRGPGATGPLV
jgi:fucose permease